MWCYECSSDVRGDLPFNSVAHIHTSVALLTLRDLTRRHASHISVVAHVTWSELTSRAVSSSDVSSCDITRAAGMWEAIYNLILWRRFTLLSLCLRHVIPCASTHLIFVVAHVTWGELTWREDSVYPASESRFAILRTCLKMRPTSTATNRIVSVLTVRFRRGIRSAIPTAKIWDQKPQQNIIIITPVSRIESFRR